MNKSKNLILPILFFLISFAVLILGFDKIGIISVFDSDVFPDSFEVNYSVKSNSQLVDELKGVYLKPVQKNNIPDTLNAFWFDINKDIVSTNENSTEEVKYEIYSSFDYYRNFVPNAIFLKPDTENEFAHLLEPDGNVFDILAYTLYYAGTLDLCRFLVLDDSLIYNDKGEFTTENLAYYLNNYIFDGVLLSADSLYSTVEYFEGVKYFSEYLSKEHERIYFGCEVHTDFEKVFADDYVINVFEHNLVDFGYVDCMTSTTTVDYPYSTISQWWNSFADYYDIPFYCEHRADLIFSDEEKWGLSTEINLQLKSLYNCPAFKGSCYFRAGYLKSNKALARDLAIILNDVTDSSQDTFSVESLSLNGNKVNFSGMAISDSVNIYCNSTRILQKDGFFEESYVLSPGLNSFDFFSNFGQYTYKIYNNQSLISSCYPNDDILINRNLCNIEAYAVCPEGSVVFAVFDGMTHEMTISSDKTTLDVPDGYCVYSSDISLTDKRYNGSEITFCCFYKDLYHEISPCHVFSDKIKDIDEQQSLSAVSPFTDNGLGQSLMCMIDFDDTEQISFVEDYDTYHPYKSCLPKGTIDYVEKINVSSGGYIVYELKSGINVYGVDCVLINNGYNLPLNNYSLIACDESSSDETKLTFAMDWFSPVTVTVKNPDYKVGYENFSFNIDSYNSSAVDITFYYSGNFDLSKGLSFSDDSVFYSYEIIKNEHNTVVLRLHLKKAGAFYGYKITKNDNGELELSFKKRTTSSIEGKVVMIDPGHGGLSMVGTAIMDNTVSEAQVTLAIANRTKYYLEELGAEVVMTRVMDSSLTLSERTDICKSINPDIFISIHCDGVDNTDESGTHTFYYNAYSQPLADNIHRELVSTYLNNIYVEADLNYFNVDRKIKYYPFYVTRVSNCPAVLIECGFMSNYVEGYVLSNPVNQDFLGKAISDGIVNYFSNA